MNISLIDYVVMSGNKVDHQATLHKFSGDLQRYKTEKESQDSLFKIALEQSFSQYNKRPLSKPFLVNEVLSKINAQPENYKEVGQQVLNFIEDNCNGEESWLVSVRGKGIIRRADIE